MQAQITKSKTITSAQSLATVQTLLRAGLGCVTYLRNLLPVENFSDSYFTSSKDDPLSYQSTDNEDSSSSKALKRNVSSFKVMTVTRGFTEEADKLLDYMEHGIFDALQKQYLRRFIFAIYLDKQDPNNIVEAYTFNFDYFTLPGTSTVIPIMSLGEDLSKLSVNENRPGCDPVAEAARRGKQPTLGDVKKSVKALLKQLIQVTTHLDSLPKRRFATFKLFYTDNTPSDYEPPHFQPGDRFKDKWYFTTHNKQEVPEKWSMGKLDTGHHGVNVSVTSVAAYLPSSTEYDNAAFAGTTDFSATPAEDATLRENQESLQLKDAEERNMAWAADGDDPDADADGEEDPDYVQRQDGNYERIFGAILIGVRNFEGKIEPILGGEVKVDVDGLGTSESEVFFSGALETVPSRVGDLALRQLRDEGKIAQTQSLEETQRLHFPSPAPSIGPLSSSTALGRSSLQRDGPNTSSPLSSPEISSNSSLARPSSDTDIDTERLRDMMLADVASNEDSEMLDLETQVNSAPADDPDSIGSFGMDSADDVMSTHTQKNRRCKSEQAKVVDNGLDCECGVKIEDECCLCEGGCGRWYHLWCMGYHSTKDKRIPHRFTCFDCRVRGDFNWELIKDELYPEMISRFKELALIRRGIKVAETNEPDNVSDFKKLIGCEGVVAHQIFKRLEAEGFIAVQETSTDEVGLLETTRTRTNKNKGKAKGKAAKPRKNLQKTKYAFLKSSKRSALYLDYFNPDLDVERRLLGLSELAANHKAMRANRTKVANLEGLKNAVSDLSLCDSNAAALQALSGSQTQESPDVFTQDVPPFVRGADLKRVSRAYADSRPNKKIKISVGIAVDLGE